MASPSKAVSRLSPPLPAAARCAGAAHRAVVEADDEAARLQAFHQARRGLGWQQHAVSLLSPRKSASPYKLELNRFGPQTVTSSEFKRSLEIVYPVIVLLLTLREAARSARII